MPITPSDFAGVIPVPALARRNDERRSLDFPENEKLVRHITEGGITRLMYGGNAFLHHLTLLEYEQVLEWLSGLKRDFVIIPSAGPSYGRAMDQASLLRKHRFPCVMMLPCGDPRDAEGLERGYGEFAEAAETRLIIYLKDETNFGPDKQAGLDAIGRLADSGTCAAIKYAIVRSDPATDRYLEALLKRVDRSKVISGIGERPAVCHMRDWKLAGFTTGSGCVAPRLSNDLHEACRRGDFHAAEELRQEFLPLEDIRDAWGPSRVLHAAISLSGIAETGPIPPYVSPLSAQQLDRLAPVARALLARNAEARALATSR